MKHPIEQPSESQFDSSLEEYVISGSASPLSTDLPGISASESAQAYRRLLLLYDLGRKVFSEIDEDSVFQAILSAVSSLLNMERALIAVMSRGTLIPRAVRGIELSDDTKSWPISSMMLDRVLSEGVSILTTDARCDEKFSRAKSVDLHNIRSVICCPLGKAGQPTGMIYVDNRMRTGAFSRSDLEFLTALSHYATLAVAHAAERRHISGEKELAEARLDVMGKEMAARYNIVGVSSQIVRLFGLAQKAARSDVPVLIIGETGTGKEVLARSIHHSSPRASKPFVPVHVGSFPSTIVGSELFGYEKGAFTGADKKRIGRFELANGGTLFLDEVLDIPLDVQPTLLRVLQEQVFERLGSSEPIETDVRIICACNRDPNECITDGHFREDLYYRLNSVTLEIPPLRDRPEDIEPLFHHFLKECNSSKRVDERALFCLRHYSWPGNVRELQNCALALNTMVDGAVICETDLAEKYRSQKSGPASSTSALEPLADVIMRVERDFMVKALELAGGNKNEAIRLLGISREKFFKRMKQFRL